MRNRLLLPRRRRSLLPRMRRLRHLPPAHHRGGGGGLRRRSGTRRPLTRTGSPILLHPSAGRHELLRRLWGRILEWVLEWTRI
jgi:hypothetical protein